MLIVDFQCDWNIVPFDSQHTSLFPPPQQPLATINLLSAYVSLTSLDSSYKLLYSICPLLFDLFRLACPQGSSKLLEMAELPVIFFKAE